MVRAILIKKSGLSLAEDDDRPGNFDTIELYHDVIARLWERVAQAETDTPIRDFQAYAAMVTYNAWSDHLRAKYPERTSLKQSIRYFFTHQPKYAVWTDAHDDTQCGLKGWALGAAPSTRGAALRAGTTRLPPGSVPAKQRDRFKNADWDRLFTALFAALGGPATLDEVVGIVAQLIGLVEPEAVAPPAHDDDSSESAPGLDDAAATLTPEALLSLREQLALLWQSIRALKLDYRRPYVLNPPAADGTRGEIGVLVEHQVARIADIGHALALTQAEFDRLWLTLELEPDDRTELAELTTVTEHFAMLYKYLPISDSEIGALMAIDPQQVINRRTLALRALRQALAAHFDRAAVR